MLRAAVEGLPASVDVPKIKRHAGLNELAATGAATRAGLDQRPTSQSE